MLVNPASNPDPSLPASWVASAAVGGQPTGSPLNLSLSTMDRVDLDAATLGKSHPDNSGRRSGWRRPAKSHRIPDWQEIPPPPASGPTPPTPAWSIVPGPDGTRVLRMEFPRIAALTGYILEVQSSPDMVTWQFGFSLKNSTPQPDGGTLQQWEKTLPTGTTRQSCASAPPPPRKEGGHSVHQTIRS